MKIGFLFPGQGSQSVGMGKDIYEQFEEVKKIYNKVYEITGIYIKKITFEGPEEELNLTKNTQLAILTMELGILEVLKEKGINADISAGLSLGEYSALIYSGAISLEDGIRIVQKRGEYMQNLVPEGEWMMSAIMGLEDNKVDEICEKTTKGFVVPANYNYKGQVVMSDAYANALVAVLGSSAMDSNGRGGTFSTDKIPEIIAQLVPGHNAEEFKQVMDGNKLSTSYNASGVQTTTGEATGNQTTVDNSDTSTAIIQKLIDFYEPIFKAAASNGWTKEYNNEMKLNDNYVSDALVSGSFQLETVNDEGNYDPDTSLTYFVTAGDLTARTDSEVREELTAWYNAEKERISEKESWIDMDINNLSTELEAINTEIQSVQSYLDDAISTVFDWGSG